jgi:peptide-methionine (S)-S-oxide reductase
MTFFKKCLSILGLLAVVLTAPQCTAQNKHKAPAQNQTQNQTQNQAKDQAISLTPPKGKAVAAFAEGCFWCTEHVFDAVAGVEDVVSGYAGGFAANPNYESVGAHETGHAEAVLVYYDPKVVSFSELLKVFFDSHDPTTLNQQGPDAGTPYRSIAFYQNKEEKSAIEKEIQVVNASKRYKNKVVTEVTRLEKFYKAEEYHQDYIQNNPDNPYVQHVSIPRFAAFKKVNTSKLKQ